MIPLSFASPTSIDASCVCVRACVRAGHHACYYGLLAASSQTAKFMLGSVVYILKKFVVPLQGLVLEDLFSLLGKVEDRVIML